MSELKPCPFAKELRIQGIGEPDKTVGWFCSAACNKCPARNPLRHGYNSVFNQITQSPEVLADTLVIPDEECNGWYSVIIKTDYGQYFKWFSTHTEALEATVAKLKEVKR